MNTFDLGVVFVYMAAMLGIGFWFVRKSRSPEAFMAAGRSLPAWAVGLSIFGTYVSSISFLALPAAAYGPAGWNPFAFSLSLPVTAAVAVCYFVPFYRKRGAVSAYEHLEQRFGAWARTYAVLCYLLTQLMRMGMITYLVALAVSPLAGLSLPVIIVVIGVCVTIYTLVGGIEAVVWTDVVQSLVLMAGVAACVVVVLAGTPGGPAATFRVALDHDKFSLGRFGGSLTEPTFWVVLVYGLFINLQNFGIDQSYVQRYQTAESDAAAARSLWLGALLYLPISALFLFIGTSLFAYYRAWPERIPAEEAAQPDKVFPHFMASELPVGVLGLLIAAILAAAMSTISSSLNCSATLCLCDLYKRYLRPGAGERESMVVLRVVTLLGGVASTVTALAMIQVKSALDAWWKLAGIFSGGMLGLFLLGRMSRRASSAAALAGVGSGLVVIFWMTLSRQLGLPEELCSRFHEYLVVVFGTLAIFFIGFAATWLFGSRPV